MDDVRAGGVHSHGGTLGFSMKPSSDKGVPPWLWIQEISGNSHHHAVSSFECLGKTLVDHVFLYNGHDSYAACSPLGMFQTAFASKLEGLRCSNYECWVHYPTSEKTELLNLGKKSEIKRLSIQSLFRKAKIFQHRSECFQHLREAFVVTEEMLLSRWAVKSLKFSAWIPAMEMMEHGGLSISRA